MRKQKKESIVYLVVLLAMILVSVAYAYKIGLLFCGYYFADDHEIARLHGGIVRDGLWATMRVWLEADTNLRFRPVYWIFRVMEAYFCGTHVVVWHFIKACEIGFCAWVSFLFARKMKAPYVVSVLFALVGFFGTQCAVVYRLGPQEPLALIFLFLGLICAVEYGAHIRHQRWYLVGFHGFMTLMMMTKESFLILVPICVFFFLYRQLSLTCLQEEKMGTALKKVLKSHVGTILYEALVFLLCMGVIVFHSGVSSTGYAGLDASYTLSDYLTGIGNIWSGELLPYLLLAGAAIIVNLGLCFVYGSQKGFVLFRWCDIGMVLYFILSQSVLHAKTGMSERYLFPCITGILIYVCCQSIPLWINLGKEKGGIPKLYKTAALELLLGAWAVFMAVNSQFHALCLNYVYTCSNNTQMLIRLSELALDHGGQDCKIIVSTPYGEWNLALCAFMEELYGIEGTYALSQSDPANVIAVDRYTTGEEQAGTLTLPEADIYVAQKEFLPDKMREQGIEYQELYQEVFAPYIIYVK